MGLGHATARAELVLVIRDLTCLSQELTDLVQALRNELINIRGRHSWRLL